MFKPPPEWSKPFVNGRKITLIEVILGERVRAKQRGWDALNRTQTARSCGRMGSQFIFIAEKNGKNTFFPDFGIYFTNHSTVRISGPPSVT